MATIAINYEMKNDVCFLRNPAELFELVAYFVMRDEGTVYRQCVRPPYYREKLVIPGEAKIVSFSAYSGVPLIFLGLSENGDLYGWKNKEVKLLPFYEPIIHISSCEMTNTIINVVTESQQIYQFDLEWSYATPVYENMYLFSLPESAGDVVFIGCYRNYTVALTSKGAIFKWTDLSPSTNIPGTNIFAPIENQDLSKYFFAAICPQTERDSTILALTLDGKVLLLDLDGSEPPSLVDVDQTYGIPIAITPNYLLTSSGTVLSMTDKGFTVPIMFNGLIVDMYQKRDFSIFLDETGKVFSLSNLSIIPQVIDMPLVIPSPLLYPVPWSIPFRRSVSERVQQHVVTLLSFFYNEESIFRLLAREILYQIFYFLM